MREILDYTRVWLKIALSETEKMNGHAFYSEIPQKFPLRNTGISMDGVYYALCLIESYVKPGDWRPYNFAFVLDYENEYKQRDSRVPQPTAIGGLNRHLVWNLYHSLRSIDLQLAKIESN